MEARKAIIAVAAVCIAIAVLMAAFSGLEKAGDSQTAARLEEALMRGAVTCYAVEGIYPPTLTYLTENYNVKIDDDRYYVDYEVFASNIMPEITVIEK